MNIDYKKIKKECPKSFNKFLDDCGCTYPHWMGNLCYCDFEKFFDDNGIYIKTVPNDYNNKTFAFEIEKHKNEDFGLIKLFQSDYIYIFRPEAKKQAIYKAFSIMEEL